MSARSREFELAVKTFTGDLYRFAFWLARDRCAAEDLVQECFQRAWTNWESLNDPVALKWRCVEKAGSRNHRSLADGRSKRQNLTLTR